MQPWHFYVAAGWLVLLWLRRRRVRSAGGVAREVGAMRDHGRGGF